MTKKMETNGTFRFQGSLPRLPVPPLEETLGKLLLWTAPLLEESGRRKTTASVEEFLAPGGAGRKLQRRLEQWADKDAPENWLDPFWLQTYLENPLPLAINSNVFNILDLPLPPGPHPQAERGAELVTAALSFKKAIDGETLSPDMDKLTPLCMAQYPRVFGSDRVPGPEKDKLAFSSGSRHMIVFFRERAWSMEIVSSYGEQASRESIAARLAEITAKNRNSKGEGLGILTTIHRRYWADVRKKLMDFARQNAENLHTIESAMFVLCLDETTGKTLDEKGLYFLAGGQGNRWYDKSVQFIVDGTGEAAMNMEHSSIDGSVVARLASFLASGSGKKPGGEWSVPPPLPLDFLLSEELENDLENAEHAHIEARNNTKLAVLEFTSFGKEKIKRLGASPDAFCQIALSTTAFDLWGKFRTAYEAVMTRRFLHGRTEAMRPVTPELADFVLARTADNLRRASSAHRERIRECQEGRGVDRHLFGLQKIFMLFGEEIGIHGVPSLFSSPGVVILSRNILSTSTSAATGFRIYGYGPADDEGFGIRYLMFPDKLTFTMTCRAAMEPKLFALRNLLARNLEAMARIMKE